MNILKRFLQILLPVIALSIVLFVWWTSIHNNGGLRQTFSFDRSTETYNLLRLAGLTAFTILSFQVITGTFMHFFNKLYGKNFYIFHAYTGTLVLIFALTHFALIHLYMSFFGFTIGSFSRLFPRPYIDFGPVALSIMGVTVTTAVIAVLILHQKPKHWWRYFHYANYVVFILAFLHSINIGDDVAGNSSLKPLWYFFMTVFILGLIYKRVIRVIQKKAQQES